MRFFATALGLVLVPTAVFLTSSRPLGELIGFTRAASDAALDGALEGLPDDVRDKKLDNDLRRQRRELTEHEVGLSLARRDIENLEAEVKQLEARAERRGRLLGEAAPVLEIALAAGSAQVAFAGEERPIGAFQTELDGLLDEHEREARQLELRRQGLGKLQQSVADGEAALGLMKADLASVEQELELLRTRRGQARREGQALELVEAVHSTSSVADSGLARDVQDLRNEVDRLEATNESTRSGVARLPRTSGVAADWDRLERLKAVVAAEDSASADPDEVSAETGAGDVDGLTPN